MEANQAQERICEAYGGGEDPTWVQTRVCAGAYGKAEDPTRACGKFGDSVEARGRTQDPTRVSDKAQDRTWVHGGGRAEDYIGAYAWVEDCDGALGWDQDPTCVYGGADNCEGCGEVIDCTKNGVGAQDTTGVDGEAQDYSIVEDRARARN